MTDTPILNGQVIGQAERATRAVLDSLLAETDIDFLQWVTLNVLDAAGRSIDEADLVQRVAVGLKIDGSTALGALDDIVSSGFAAREVGVGRVEFTPAGAALHDRVQTGIGRITERLYRDLPADDLAIAGRVLTLITARANAELAG
jgi:DNA-binding MarR family transcriptional regulator